MANKKREKFREMEHRFYHCCKKCSQAIGVFEENQETYKVVAMMCLDQVGIPVKTDTEKESTMLEFIRFFDDPRAAIKIPDRIVELTKEHMDDKKFEKCRFIQSFAKNHREKAMIDGNFERNKEWFMACLVGGYIEKEFFEQHDKMDFLVDVYGQNVVGELSNKHELEQLTRRKFYGAQGIMEELIPYHLPKLLKLMPVSQNKVHILLEMVNDLPENLCTVTVGHMDDEIEMRIGVVKENEFNFATFSLGNRLCEGNRHKMDPDLDMGKVYRALKRLPCKSVMATSPVSYCKASLVCSCTRKQWELLEAARTQIREQERREREARDVPQNIEAIVETTPYQMQLLGLIDDNCEPTIAEDQTDNNMKRKSDDNCFMNIDCKKQKN